MKEIISSIKIICMFVFIVACVPQKSGVEVQSNLAELSISLKDAENPFFEKELHSTSQGSYLVTNNGTRDIAVITVEPLIKDGPFVFQDNVDGNCFDKEKLAPKESCLIVVAFTPSDNGVFTDNLKINYNNGINNVVVSAKIQGIGGTLGNAALIAHSQDMGVTPSGTILTKTITVKNEGGLPLKGMETHFETASVDSNLDYIKFKGNSYPGSGGTCGTTLEAGASCTMVVEFAPPANAVLGTLHKYYLKLAYKDPYNPMTLSIDLQAVCEEVAGRLKAEDGISSLSFGTVLKGKTKTKMMTFYNKGFLTLNITGMTISAPFSVVPGSSSCQGIGTMQINDFCTYTFEFAPTDAETAGAYSQNVVINYDGGLGPRSLTVSLDGTIQEPAILAMKFEGAVVTSYDFGSLGTFDLLIKSFKLTNIGGFDATAVSIGALGSPFTKEYIGCGTKLVKGASCDIKIKFWPSSVAGSFGGLDELVVSYNNGVTAGTIMNFGLTGSSYAKGFLTFNATSEIDEFDNYHEYMLMGSSIVGTVDPAKFTPADANNILYHDFARTKVFKSLVNEFKIENIGTGAISNITLPALDALGPQQVYDQFGIPTSTWEFTTAEMLGKPFRRLVSSQTPDCYNDFAAPFALNPGEFCYVRIQYTPGENSSATDNADFVFNYEAVGVKSAKLVLTAESIQRANLVTTSMPVNVVDFGLLSVGNESNKYFQIINTGTLRANFSAPGIFTNADYRYGHLGDFPGVNPGSALFDGCASSLSANEECWIQLISKPQGAGANPGFLELYYRDDLGEYQVDLSLTTNAGSYANIKINDPGLNSQDDALAVNLGVIPVSGTSAALVLPILNNGQSTACNITCSIPAFLTVDQACPTTLNSNQSLDLIVRFTPPSAVNYQDKITINYDHDCDSGTPNVSLNNYVVGNGVTVGNLKIKKDNVIVTSNDYGTKIINVTTTDNFTLQNIGGAAASAVTFTFAQGGSSRYAISNLSTCDYSGTGTLNGFSTCTFRINFTPTDDDVGSNINDTLTVTYNNGVNSQTVVLELTGKGEPPLANFGSWKEIYSVAKTYRFNSGSPIIGLDDTTVRLKWTAMTLPVNYSVSKYGVWRRTSSDADYPASPMAEVAASSCNPNCTFVDTSVSEGTVYYYQIRPFSNKDAPSKVLGYGRVVESYSEIRIISPPLGMALVHRWSANLDFCARWKPLAPVEWEPDVGGSTQMHPTCDYRGHGHKNNSYDAEYDAIVDRFEVGNSASDPKVFMELTPIKVTQNSAEGACKLSANKVMINGTQYTKHLLSRKDFLNAASWASSFTDAQILANEVAEASGSQYCNGNSSVIENAGNNMSCVSRYGIYDLIGNVYEWQSDRIQNKIGVTDDTKRLDVTNRDFDGVPVGTTTALFKNGACYAPALGILVDKVGSCGTDEIDPAAIATKFHDDYYSAPASTSLAGAWSGGGNNAKITSPSTVHLSGTYTVGWAPTNYTMGFRCMVRVSY